MLPSIGRPGGTRNELPTARDLEGRTTMNERELRGAIENVRRGKLSRRAFTAG